MMSSWHSMYWTLYSSLSSHQGTRNEALYQLAVTTGMRMGELLGLKWPDIDWAGIVLNQP